jgi:uncharacterized glyoxalase superfamily protein PhnB
MISRYTALSTCIITQKVVESRDFYVKYFDAKVPFDCGWYVNLDFGNGATLQFMSPQSDQPVCNPVGLTYNFRVSDIDAEYQRITASGLVAIMPLEDHPWGDRGFAVHDPNGVVLYIYSDREPSAEFKQYYKA